MKKQYVFTFFPQMVIQAETIEEAWKAARNLTVDGLNVSWLSLKSPKGVETLPLAVIPVHAKEMEAGDGEQICTEPGEAEVVAGCVTGEGIPDGG